MSEELRKCQSYHSAPDVPQDSIERINRRLQAEMRARLRQITPAPIASGKWFEVLEHVQHLASVAVMEEFAGERGLGQSQSPVSGTVALGKAEDSSTVWERDNLCVRLIVEEGKGNLLMRLLAEFKQEMVKSGGSAAEAMGADRLQTRGYEMGLGLILRSGLTAVETAQTLDLRALLDHIALSLDNALGQHTPVVAGLSDDVMMQEYLAVSLLALLLEHLHAVNEDVVMGHFIERCLLEKVIAHAEKFGAAAIERSTAVHDVTQLSPSVDIPIAHLSKELPAAYCDLLRHFLDCDTFKAQSATFFPNREVKSRFVAAFEPLVKTVMGSAPNAEVKKRFRPLTDALLRFK